MNQNQEMAQYLGIFMDEGQEQLALLEQEILQMERGDHSKSILQSMFRAAHTLKGSSRAMGFLKIGDLTHEMENVLDDLRNDRFEVSTNVIDALLDCLDALGALMNSVAEHGSDANSGREDIGFLVDRLEALRVAKELDVNMETAKSEAPMQLSELEKDALAQAMEAESSVLEVLVKLDPNCLMKSVRIYMALETLGEIGQVIKSEPTDSQLADELFDGPARVILATQLTPAELKESLLKVSEVAHVAIRDLRKETPSFGLSEKSLTEATVPPLDKPERATSNPPQNGEVSAVRSPEPASAAAQTIRVGLHRLDSLLNLVGELVIDRTQIARLTQILQDKYKGDATLSQLGEAISRVSRITSELQDQVMKTRMLPIDGVFQRLPRMVRDLAQKTQKEVNFHVSGGETELDRSVIEILGDPLIHILRNSIDHGIELPEERTKVGKPKIGNVSISARYEESRIVIDVEDDGRGIDPDHIRKVTVKKGIFNEKEAALLSDEDAIDCILASGFSTAAAVTDISGRGVGMDIVKSNVESIGGKVLISSKPGIGTVLTIHLPLTLAIVRALLVKSVGQTYILPLSSVFEILRLDDEGNGVTRTTVAGQAVMILRGETIPLAHLARTLEGDVRAIEDKHLDSNCDVVVVGIGGRRVGICVEAVDGEQEVVIKSLGSLLGEIPGITGASILGDGRVGLIVDFAKSLEQMEKLNSLNGSRGDERVCA